MLERSWSREAAGRKGLSRPVAPPTLFLSWSRDAAARSLGGFSSPPPTFPPPKLSLAALGLIGVVVVEAEEAGLGMLDRGTGSRERRGMPLGRSRGLSIRVGECPPRGYESIGFRQAQDAIQSASYLMPGWNSVQQWRCLVTGNAAGVAATKVNKGTDV